MMRVVSMAACAAALVTWQATFSSRMEAVRVDVSVTRDGEPVVGLSAADFEVRDNGVRQQVQLVASDEVPLDVVLALDLSGSVLGERLAHLRDATRAALAALARDDRAALLTFNEQVRLLVPLTRDTATVQAALAETQIEAGQTAMFDAAYAALVHADSGRGRGLAIVLSDGIDTASWLTSSSVIETAKRVDAVLYGIATGAPRSTRLADLAHASGGDLMRIEKSGGLGDALQRVMAAFRQRYLLSYVPQNVRKPGWHEIDVRVRRRGLTVKARAGYFAS